MAQFAGTVRWFNNAKGYESLGREDGPHTFRHYSSIQCDGYKTEEEGLVVFDIIQGTKKPQADQATLGKEGAR